MAARVNELDAAELEVVQALHNRNVIFVVIGSWVLNYHCVDRPWQDLDVVVEASEANAAKLLDALSDLRLAGPRLTLQELSKPGKKVSLRLRGVDILTSVDGLSFFELADGAASVPLGNLHVLVPSRSVFLRLKSLSSRPKDRRDCRKLRAKMWASKKRG